MSICQDCRESTAPNHIYDGERGKDYDLCDDCSPPNCALLAWLEKRADDPEPVFLCASCGDPTERGRCPIVVDPRGTLHHRHDGCPVPEGWTVIPTVKIKRVATRDPAIAEALGIPLEEDPDGSG